MSTNYYWTPADGSRLATAGQLHIGKSAGGWSFLFQSYRGSDAPTEHALDTQGAPTLVSWKDWKQLVSTEQGQITDEYDREITLAEFFQLVEVAVSPTSLFNGRPVLSHVLHLREDPRYRGESQFQDDSQYWLDPAGYSFSLGEFS